MKDFIYEYYDIKEIIDSLNIYRKAHIHVISKTEMNDMLKDLVKG